jgi:hypothetical protein
MGSKSTLSASYASSRKRSETLRVKNDEEFRRLPGGVNTTGEAQTPPARGREPRFCAAGERKVRERPRETETGGPPWMDTVVSAPCGRADLPSRAASGEASLPPASVYTLRIGAEARTR